MSPTVFREGCYRFFFFSREESRKHVHVMGPNGEAKIWLEPEIGLADVSGFSRQEIYHLLEIVEAHKNDIIEEWHRHFRC